MPEVEAEPGEASESGREPAREVYGGVGRCGGGGVQGLGLRDFRGDQYVRINDCNG